MSALTDLIATIPDLDDAEAVRAEVTAKTIRIVVYQGEQTVAAIDTAYGTQFAAAVVMGFEAAIAAMKAGNDEEKATGALWQIYYDRLKSPGWDLSDDAIRARLDNLVPIVGQEVVDAIKALGVVYRSPCEINGIPDPSLSEVQQAIAVIQNRRETASWVAYIENEILRPRHPDATIVELKAAVLGLE